MVWLQELEQVDEEYNFRTSHSMRTVTSQKQLNENSFQELLTNIFSSVSHEFGTYLNCIISLSSLLIEMPDIIEEIRVSYLIPIY